MFAFCATFCSHAEKPENKENARMSASVETAPPRDRSIETRRAARLAKAGRERRILDLLNRGVSVAEIAAVEGVTEKRMRGRRR
jgi:DNA-binding NarL/FixJ family response regulator